MNLIEKLAREHGTGGWQTLDDMVRFGEAVAAAERERVCAAIKVEDDHCADGDYMMDSDDCIKVVRGMWERPDWNGSNVMSRAKLARDTGPCSINWPSNPPESGLQPRFFFDILDKCPVLKIP